MPFLMLMLLALACLPENWPQPLAWFGVTDGYSFEEVFAVLTWGGVGLLVALARRIARRTQQRLYLEPDQREHILFDYLRRRRFHYLGVCVYLLLAVYGLGWGWTVQSLMTVESDARPGRLLAPGAELLVVAPFFASLVLSWGMFYAAERAAHLTAPPAVALAPYWSRWAYVRFHLRQNLALIVVPLLFLIVDKGMRRLYPDAEYDWGFKAASACLLPVLFIGLPWILRLALGLRPLPAGPLRDRLEACARRLGFRCSNILLWDTHGVVANAMVAGILPWLRYVLLSDRLIAELTPAEIEAVFGHEIGHVKHRHMFYYLGFLFLSLTVVTGLWGLLANALFADPNGYLPFSRDLEMVPLVAIAGAYIFVVFGFLSRRCERQADIFGCRAVSCSRPDCCGHAGAEVLAPGGHGLCPTGIRTFIDALEKVAHVNGIHRHRPGWLQSWQHSTIARRVEFLQRVLADPGLEPRFQRTVALVKWGLLLVLVATLWALGTSQGWDKLGLF